MNALQIESLYRRRIYLKKLATGASKSDAAKEACVRLDHLPYWRKKHPSFARDEALIDQRARAARDASRVIQCVCGETLIGAKGQEFCSRSCAQKEIKTSYWGPRDTEVLDALSGSPLARREILSKLNMPLSTLRSILPRLLRRGLVKRVGAKRGLYCKWARVA